MNSYRFVFIGRKKNAIGKVYNISQLITAKDIETARKKLYELFENIRVKTITKVKNNESVKYQ